MKDCNFKVYIYCASFNHSRYIKDALDGFCMQQTDFPYVCAIKDDASTDGEPDIIRKYIEDNFETSDDVFYTEETEYANIIFARHKTNKNCFIAAVLLKYNHYSIKKPVDPYFEKWRKGASYISLCEGDDYWIDPLKLQKQVCIMENYPECSIVISNGILLHEATRKTEIIDPIGDNIPTSFISIEQMLIEKNYLIPTASMCFRSDIYKQMPDFFKQCPIGDKPLRTWQALNGKVYYFNEPMVTYRSGAIGSFSFWSGRKPGYAQKLYQGMHEYYNALNDYTDHEYDKLIKYLDDKEEFFYYKRVNKLFKMMQCPFYLQLSKAEQKKEIKDCILSYVRHKGRIMLTVLHLNWIYPKK